MKLEILIYADVKDFADDDINTVKREIKDEIEVNISKFAGNNITKKGMWNDLENLDHEVTFDDEGHYEYEKVEDDTIKLCSDKRYPRYGKPLINGECREA